MTVSGRRELSPRAVMLAAFGVTSALNYAFGFAMGWLLSPGDYGLLAFAQSVLLVGGLVLQSGFSWSLARGVVNAEGPGERDALVRGSLLANLILGVALGGVLILLFFAGPLRGGFERWSVAVVVAAALPFISVLATARGCAQGSERFGIVASIGLTEMGCKTLSGATLALAGLGAPGAVAGFLVGAVCAAVLGVRRISRGIGVRLRGGLRRPDVLASGAMFGALLGTSLLLNLDLAGLKLLSEERAAAGFYQAGIVLSNAPYYLVATALLPVLFVQLARHEGLADTRATLGETLGLTAALVLPIEFALMAVPEQALLTLFPDSYAQGAETLRLLAVGNCMLILAAVLSAAFQAVGRARVPALILLALALAEPFALWKVVPENGARGAALVFVVSASLALLCLTAAYLREAGAPDPGPLASWLLRYALAVGTALAAGRLVLGADFGVHLAVAAGGAGYLVAATLLRLIRPLAMLPGRGGPLNVPATSKEG